MLALCWHNMPAHYAFYFASIFDGGLIAALDDPRRGGLGAQPPDADERLICHCL